MLTLQIKGMTYIIPVGTYKMGTYTTTVVQENFSKPIKNNILFHNKNNMTGKILLVEPSVADLGCFIPDPDPNIFSSQIRDST
jgi:hypothetical protein